MKISKNIYATICIASCIASFLISIFITKNPTDAGRGGAICVMLSFYSMFANRVSQKQFIDSFKLKLDPDKSRETDLSKLEADYFRFKKIMVKSAEQLDANDKESKSIAILGGLLGTLVWGFADLLADVFIC